MAQGQSTKIISMIKWIRTRGLSMKDSLSVKSKAGGLSQVVEEVMSYAQAGYPNGRNRHQLVSFLCVRMKITWEGVVTSC